MDTELIQTMINNMYKHCYHKLRMEEPLQSLFTLQNISNRTANNMFKIYMQIAFETWDRRTKNIGMQRGDHELST